MRKLKQYEFVLAAFLVLAVGVSFGQTLLGSWDMSGTPTGKTVDTIMADAGYPNGGFVSQERTVLEYAAGDIVYGKPREAITGVPAQSADGEGASGQAGDVSMLFNGALGQSAHIGEVMRPITTAFKVKFDFKLYQPEIWADATTMTILMDGSYTKFSIRLNTAANGSGGTGSIRFYCFKPGGNAYVDSAYTVNMTGWNTIECWLQNGVLNLKLNDDDVVTAPLNGTLNEVAESAYDGITLGARWDGGRYYARIYMDNVELYKLEDDCGSWGYLPTDFNQDCFVDIEDLAYIVNQWLVCTDPQGVDCVELN